MKDDLGLKLIAVTGINKLKLFCAKGIKITEQLNDIDLNISGTHKKSNKKQSLFQQKSGPGSLFEPHTLPKDIEHQEAAREISAQLDKLIMGDNKYREVIIAAEPKMLGFIRQQLSNGIKKLEHREIHKDLLTYNKSQLEDVLFSK